MSEAATYLLVATLSGYFVAIWPPEGGGFTKAACERNAASWPDRGMQPMCLTHKEFHSLMVEVGQTRDANSAR